MIQAKMQSIFNSYKIFLLPLMSLHVRKYKSKEYFVNEENSAGELAINGILSRLRFLKGKFAICNLWVHIVYTDTLDDYTNFVLICLIYIV